MERERDLRLALALGCFVTCVNLCRASGQQKTFTFREYYTGFLPLLATVEQCMRRLANSPCSFEANNVDRKK